MYLLLWNLKINILKLVCGDTFASFVFDHVDHANHGKIISKAKEKCVCKAFSYAVGKKKTTKSLVVCSEFASFVIILRHRICFRFAFRSAEFTQTHKFDSLVNTK